MRDGHFTAEVRRFDFERMESSVRRTVFAGSESTGGFECNRLIRTVTPDACLSFFLQEPSRGKVPRVLGAINRFGHDFTPVVAECNA